MPVDDELRKTAMEILPLIADTSIMVKKPIHMFVELYTEQPNLTMTEMAKRCGVSRITLYKWLNKPAIVAIIKAKQRLVFSKKLYQEAIEGTVADRRLFAEFDIGWTPKAELKHSGNISNTSLSSLIEAEKKSNESK